MPASAANAAVAAAEQTENDNEIDSLACFAWQAMLVDPPVSVALFNELVRRKPENGEFWSALGLALAKASRTAEAISAFDKAVSIHPKNIEAWCTMGELAMDQLDWPRAAKALKKCLELDPHGKHPSGLRARALIKKGEKLLAQAT